MGPEVLIEGKVDEKKEASELVEKMKNEVKALNSKKPADADEEHSGFVLDLEIGLHNQLPCLEVRCYQLAPEKMFYSVKGGVHKSPVVTSEFPGPPEKGGGQQG